MFYPPRNRLLHATASVVALLLVATSLLLYGAEQTSFMNARRLSRPSR